MKASIKVFQSDLSLFLVVSKLHSLLIISHGAVRY